jgi:hypothetical protein
MEDELDAYEKELDIYAEERVGNVTGRSIHKEYEDGGFGNPNDHSKLSNQLDVS